jgi:hypothetical protein
MTAIGPRVDALEAHVLRTVARLGTPAELERIEVVVDSCDRPSAGSRPACVMHDARGRRYFFKSAPVDLVAAEILAGEVRRLGGRPALATAPRRLELPDMGLTDGMIQPMLDHAGERLPTDPVAWSEVQREVMLREHPWEWLLANLDTHVDQYVLVGPEKVPFNIDWDHTMLDLHVEELTRVTSRNPAIPPLRNALYDAYVRGQLDLDLRGMLVEVRRVQRLDERALGRAVRAWSRRCGHDDEQRRTAATAFFRRKDAIARTFNALVRSLRAERAATLDPRGGAVPLPERARLAAIGAWQRFVIDTLHDRAIMPWLRVYRGALARRDALLGRTEEG